MSKRTTNINQRLNDISKETRDQYLKLIKVDPEAVRKIESTTAKQYDDIVESLKPTIMEMGKEEEKQYHLTVERYNKLHFEAVQAFVDLPRVPADYMLPICYCFPYSPAEFIEKNVPEPIIIGNTTALHDPGSTPMAYKLMVDAKGPGIGTSMGEIKAVYKYTFEPPKTGTYCISPHVFLNGHWLAWSWGTCSTPQDTGEASVNVKIKVRVDQLSVTVKSHEHIVLDVTKQAGANDQSGFSYNSVKDGGSSTKVYLMGGYDAVVFVEVMAIASVLKHGRAIVDMKTSPSFSCTVDSVMYGRRKCLPIRWDLADIVEALQI